MGYQKANFVTYGTQKCAPGEDGGRASDTAIRRSRFSNFPQFQNKGQSSNPELRASVLAIAENSFARRSPRHNHRPDRHPSHRPSLLQSPPAGARAHDHNQHHLIQHRSNANTPRAT